MTVLVGQTTSGTTADFVANGDPVAFKFTAAASGTLATIFASLGRANATLSSMELGIYSHDSVNNRPGTKLASTTTITGTFTGTGTFSGDVSASAVSITASTIYWLALRSVGEQVDFQGNAGSYQEVIVSQVLPGTWPAGAGTGTVAITIWGEDAGVAPPAVLGFIPRRMPLGV